MILGAKVKALVHGRYNVSFDDIRGIAVPALRHRMIVNYEAEVAGVTPEEIIRDLLQHLSP